MKESLKKKGVRIVFYVLGTLILIFYVISVVLEQFYLLELPYNLPVCLAFVIVLSLLIAFVSGDVSQNRYRRKEKLWAAPLPNDVKQHIWDLRTPWLLLVLLTIIIAIIDTFLWR